MRKPLPDFLRYRLRHAAAASARERREAPAPANDLLDAADTEARFDGPAIEGPQHGLHLNSRSASASKEVRPPTRSSINASEVAHACYDRACLLAGYASRRRELLAGFCDPVHAASTPATAEHWYKC
jgi:hypothetical protein